jgi:hypothetical protein
LAKRNQKVHYGVWLVLFVAVVGIFATTSSANSIFAFSLSPLSFQGNVDLPDILCNVKSNVQGLDANGEVVLTQSSTPLEKHPRTTFSLVGGQNDTPVDKFKIDNRMRCDFINNAPFVPMTVSSSDLKVVIYAKDSTGVEKEVWNDSVKSNSNVPIVNNHEESLDNHFADTVDIDDFLEQGNYESAMRIVTFGTVTLHYDGYESVKYDVEIPDNKITTYLTLDVVKDTPSQSGTPTPSNDPQTKTTSSDISDITGTLLAFQLCASTLDISCLTNQAFLPYYVVSLGGIFLVGAMTTRNSKVAFDQFGNRM